MDESSSHDHLRAGVFTPFFLSGTKTSICRYSNIWLMLQEWPRWTANVTLNHVYESVAYKYVKLRADAAIIQVALFAIFTYIHTYI